MSLIGRLFIIGVVTAGGISVAAAAGVGAAGGCGAGGAGGPAGPAGAGAGAGGTGGAGAAAANAAPADFHSPEGAWQPSAKRGRPESEHDVLA